MSDTPILEDTERTSGRSALRKNIQAAMALAGAVRSTLGPKGLDKLLVDDQGRVLVTNDGVTVLETAKVEHPVAKMIINASSLQDRQVRDGTTSTVLLAAEMLNNAWYLISEGIHPSIVARGYHLAMRNGVKALEEISKQPENEDWMLLAARTSLAGKGESNMQQRVAKLACDALDVMAESGDVDSNLVKKLTITGGTAAESELVKGLVIPKKAVDRDVKVKDGGKILLLDGGIERRTTTTDASIMVKDTGVLEEFKKMEVRQVMDEVNAILDLGVNLVALKDGIDDEAKNALSDAGVVVYRRMAANDMDLLSRATGAAISYSASTASENDLGVFDSSKEQIWNGVTHWVLQGPGSGLTFISRGGTKEIIDEVERCFDDALGVVCQLHADSSILPGGGASHTALARQTREYANSISGREALAVEAWADACEIIPRVLAENAGLDPMDELLQLVAAQSIDGDSIGLDILNQSNSNMFDIGVIEPLGVIRQSIQGATDSAIAILRIDDVLWAKQDAEIPEDVQHQLG